MTALARLQPVGFLAVKPPSDLGFFADAVENHPIVTLTTTGALVGALWGGLLGWGASGVIPGGWQRWVGYSAAAGGLAVGAKGYIDGKALADWLAANA